MYYKRNNSLMFFFLNFTYLIETHVQAALALDGSIRIAKLAIHYSLGGYYGGKNLYENIIVDDNIGILQSCFILC
jgi:hypothetical protein